MDYEVKRQNIALSVDIELIRYGIINALVKNVLVFSPHEYFYLL